MADPQKPIKDEWEQEAANMQSAPVQQEAPEQPGAISRFLGNAADSLIGTHTNEGIGEAVTVGLPHMVKHPIDSLKLLGGGMLDAQNAELDKAAEYAAKPGISNKIGAGVHAAEFALPVIGPMMGKASTQFEHGDVAGGLGSMAAPASIVAAPKFSEVAAEKIGTPATPGSLGKITEPTRPVDISARKLTKTINPPVSDWNEFSKSTEQQAGNIRDFALRNKLPLETQLDWSKASQAYATDANKGFRSVFDPMANEQVSVAGSGYQGATVGEGQRATLGSVLDRITKINDELRANYEKRTSGQVRTALANDSDLVAEKTSLTNLLNNEVGRRAGIKPEQVSELRRPGAQGFSIADNTKAAMNQRESSSGKIMEGRRDVPASVMGVLGEGFNRYVRGGPEKIADRAFRGEMRKSLFPVTEPPQISPPTSEATPRTPLWLQGGKDFPPSPLENKTFIEGDNKSELSRMATNEQNRSTGRLSRMSERTAEEAKRKKNFESHGKIGR
jgi:hypothetical protein